MISATLYCDSCGAANRAQAAYCFACGQFLHASAGKKPSNSSSTGLLVYNFLLKQRYRIIQQVGKGGFGAVYKAADTQLGGRPVAVKEMSQSGLGSQEIIEAANAFKREAHLLADLLHPNLPRIYDHFAETGRWYLVMDFIEGETLETYLNKVGTGKLPLEKALDIGIQICVVLDYLHKRQPSIIFRDLKPANIMLTPTGHLYLIDFGIARLFKPGQARDTTALGSSGYAAPEQYGKAQSTPRTDIYSLGATLHQLLTGNDPSDTPFQFVPLKAQSQPFPAGLDVLIKQMLDMDPGKRPDSAAAVKMTLQRIVAQHLASKTKPTQSGIPQGYKPPAQSKQSNVPPPQSNTLHVCTGHSSRITSLAWSPKGTHIASASYDKKVHVWDVHTGKKSFTYLGHAGRVLAVAWSPDGKRIASAGDDATVQIWDAGTGSFIASYRDHSHAVTAVAWSPDSTRIASTSDDKTVHVWNATTGVNTFIYRSHSAGVLAVAWSPDGQRIASAGEDKEVRIWSPTKDSKKFFTAFFNTRGQLSYAGHVGRVNALVWSPDGKRIATASSDKSMQVWDAFSGRKYFISQNRSAAVNTLAWAFDSRRIVSGSNDKTVQIWDAISRNALLTYRGHTGYVTAACWSPDGKCVASGSVDRTVQIWQAK